MKTKPQLIKKEMPSSEQLAGAIAGRILSLQRNWANWMNNSASRLSPVKTKLVLISIGLLAGCYFLALIFYPPSTAEPLKGQPLRINPIPVSPSDSLLLMEYIYKSTKK